VHHRAHVAVALGWIVAAAPACAQQRPQEQQPQEQQQSTYVVNDVALTPDLTQRLQQLFVALVHQQLPPGRYWYDRVSGAMGLDGGPAGVLLPAGLKLPGRLRANASHGTMPVFINGRQLTAFDVQVLARWLQTPVQPGRYWVDGQGNFGYEGGPMLGNLVQIANRNSGGMGRQGNTITQCYGNGGCASGNSNTGTGVITDGQGNAAVFLPGGGMVSTP
jgi:hypothetical protein